MLRSCCESSPAGGAVFGALDTLAHCSGGGERGSMLQSCCGSSQVVGAAKCRSGSSNEVHTKLRDAAAAECRTGHQQ